MSQVYGKDAINSDGREALNITIVFKSGDEPGITGKTALDAIVDIQHGLINAGEERFAVVEFATEKEMSEDCDTQS